MIPIRNVSFHFNRGLQAISFSRELSPIRGRGGKGFPPLAPNFPRILFLPVVTVPCPRAITLRNISLIFSYRLLCPIWRKIEDSFSFFFFLMENDGIPPPILPQSKHLSLSRRIDESFSNSCANRMLKNTRFPGYVNVNFIIIIIIIWKRGVLNDNYIHIV